MTEQKLREKVRRSLGVKIPVELWDWAGEQWESIGVLDWGDTPVSNAARYANAVGAVQLRISIPGLSIPVVVRSVDVTLQGKPRAP